MSEQAGLWARLASWARSRGRTAYVVTGIVHDADAAAFAQRGASAWGLDATPTPGRANLLVVVGHVTHKLAPHLLQAWQALSKPARVMWIVEDDKVVATDDGDAAPESAARKDPADASPTSERAAHYAVIAHLPDFLPVDVVVRGIPPRPDVLHDALLSLESTR